MNNVFLKYEILKEDDIGSFEPSNAYFLNYGLKIIPLMVGSLVHPNESEVSKQARWSFLDDQND